MKLAHGMALGLVTVMLVACGGVASSDPGAGSSSGGSSSSSSGGSSSGNTCISGRFTIARACVPGTAKADTPLTIDVDAAGCGGVCGETHYGCDVVREGDTLRLSFSAETCAPPAPVACASVCALPKTTCKLPPLPAGTYTIDLSALGSSSPPSPPAEPRQLVVTDAASDTTCSLGNGEPPKQDATGYSKSCNAPTDCVAVFSGDVCAGACTTTAIAMSERERYEADRRAKRSQCPPKQTAVGGPCQAPQVLCTQGQCTVAP